MAQLKKFKIYTKKGVPIISCIECAEVRFDPSGFVVFRDEKGSCLYAIAMDDLHSIQLLTPALSSAYAVGPPPHTAKDV